MLIALFITLDHCRRMHTSSSAECVAAKDGIVVRDSPTTDFRSCLAILTKTRKVVINPLHQFEVDEQLIQRRISHSFSNTESRTMYLIGPTLNRRYGVNYAQAPILMSVPIQSNIAPLFFNDTFHESYNCARAIGCRVAHSVAYTNSLCATANGRGVKGANDIRVCSRSVFGHVHDRNTLANSKRNRFLRHL